MALQHSPLGKLSPELRLNIYGHVLAPATEFSRPKTSVTGIVEPISNVLSLATTCKIIHHEFIQEFYEKAYFALDVEEISKLAQASPLASGIKFVRIAGEALSLTSVRDRETLELSVKTLEKHSTNLKVIKLLVTDKSEMYAGESLMEMFDYAIERDVARWYCGTKNSPARIIVDHAPLRSAWALARDLPDDATYDKFCLWDGRRQKLDWWYVHILADKILGVEAIEHRQRHPEDTENVGSKHLLGAKEALVKVMADVRPESDTYVSVRKVTSHHGTPICRWVTLNLWTALHLFELTKADGSLLLPE